MSSQLKICLHMPVAQRTHTSHEPQAFSTLSVHYSDMDELLTSVSPELVDEFSSDFFASRGRTVLHDSRRWRVLDTWVGDPPIYYRQVPTSVVAVGAMGQGAWLPVYNPPFYKAMTLV